MQQIEKELILSGLYMVLSKNKKELYKETNSSKDVKNINNTITVIKNLIKKLEKKI